MPARHLKLDDAVDALHVQTQRRWSTSAVARDLGVRRELAHLLAATDPSIVTIELPDLGRDGGIDGGTHLFLQLAQKAGLSALDPAWLEDTDDEKQLTMDVAQLCTALANQDKKLTLVLPDSWRTIRVTRDQASGESGTMAAAGRRAAMVLEAVLKRGRLRNDRLPITVLAAPRWVWPRTERPPPSFVVEPRPRAADYLADSTRWGCLGESARTLGISLGWKQREISSVALGIGVAAVALGRTNHISVLQPNRVANKLSRGQEIDVIVDLLRTLTFGSPQLKRMLCAASLPRLPLSLSAVATAIESLEGGSLDEVQSDILHRCFLQGASDVTMPALLKKATRAVVPPTKGVRNEERERLHASFATYHKNRDSAANLTAAIPTALDWLERIHHGVRATDEWRDDIEQVELGRRELYWDLGRSISLRGDFKRAARVFERCLDKCGDDDSYAHHYVAWNLDQAGVQPQTVEQHYNRAVELDPDNVWWHSRLVSFYIVRAQPKRANAAWQKALAALNFVGAADVDDPWVVQHLHRWVLRQALEGGELSLARRVLDSIDPCLRDGSSRDLEIVALEAQLKTFEFVEHFGRAVYPDDVPPDEWWNDALSDLPARFDDKERDALYPGQVAECGPEELTVVLGAQAPDTAAGARLMRLRLDKNAYSVADDLKLVANDFVFAAQYGDNWRIERPQAQRQSAPVGTHSDSPSMLRFLLKWGL